EPPIPIAPRPVTEFIPPEPKTLRETGASEAEVSALVLKYLLNCGVATGANIAAQIHVPFVMVQPILAQMKTDQRIIYTNSTRAGDFVCELTAAGADHARRHYKYSTYYGAVPVPLSDYVAGVEAQSIRLQSPDIGD